MRKCKSHPIKARVLIVSSIKAKKPPGFQQPQLFRKVMSLLERHHYRLPVRRFVIELFDKNLMRHIVLEDESESDSEPSAHLVPSSTSNS